MRSNTLISVIVPTFKPADYLCECLDSLNKQSLDKEKYEVILVLNGPCEPFQSQILELKNSYPSLNIHYIYTKDAGVSNARNIAIDNAKGDYITFLDDDDYLSESCLERMLEIADSNTVACCYPYAFRDGHPEQQIGYYLTNAFATAKNNNAYTINSIARKLLSGPCMKLVHKSIIADRRFDPLLRLGEDSVFVFSISDKIKKMSYTSEEAKYYRRYRNGSVTLSRTLPIVASQNLKCIIAYTRFFMRGGYSSYFFLSRMIAGVLQICRALLR